MSLVTKFGDHKFIKYLYFAALIFAPFYSWYNFLKYFNKRKKKNPIRKHFCVVTYSLGVMQGWPEKLETTSFLESYKFQLEPILHFINTANKMLDIAVMSMGIGEVFRVLEKKLKEGVKIRIIVDYSMMGDFKKIYRLQKAGADVRYHIYNNLESIMHYKFAVKDFDGENGYLLIGSMNWTPKSVQQHYDDIVFIDNVDLVKTFSENFNLTWKYISASYELSYVKSVLLDMEAKFKNTL